MKNLHYFYQHLPENIDPVIPFLKIGDFGLRWYSVGYILAIITIYMLVYRRFYKEKAYEVYNKKIIEDSIVWIVLGIVLGARFGYVLFYDFFDFITHPWKIILPFSFDGGIKFTGISGMSYHGGVVGVILAFFFFTRKYKLNFVHFMEMFVPGIPLAYTWGRLGNFMNGELFGRITASKFGMIFPNAFYDSPSVNLPAAKEIILKLGWQVDLAAATVTDKLGNVYNNLIRLTAGGGTINLPRHPSQLYEALGEGIILFFILWTLRKLNLKKGAMTAFYLIGHGFFRFVIEFVRQPDDNLFRDPGESIGTVVGVFTMGQMLSIPMILGGLFIFWLSSKKVFE